MSSTSIAISAFPIELVEKILSSVTANDLARISQASRFFFELIYKSTDQHLWRLLFRDTFDDLVQPHRPRKTEHADIAIEWRSVVQRRMRAKKTVASFRYVSSEDRIDALNTLGSIVLAAPPASADRQPSRSLTWLSALLDEHNILSLETWKPPSPEELYLKAWLRSYRPMFPNESAGAVSSERNIARAYVYDLRNYTARSCYGPFKADGSANVNWIHVDSIVQTILHNVMEHFPGHESRYPPRDFESTRLYSSPDWDQRQSIDWAGLEGTWMRHVSFMDYRDLMAYNSTEDDDHLDPVIFSSSDFHEAIRPIQSQLRIVNVKRNPENEHFPILEFRGTVGPPASNYNHTRVTGQVWMANSDIVRWKSVSIIGGTRQWSFEGFQVGGIGSAMGVVGIWTGAEHDEDDPAGPSWSWKVSGPR